MRIFNVLTRRVACLSLSVASVALATVGTATPAQADDATGDTRANVVVTGAITLTALTGAFTLSGTPNAVVENPGAVTMLVTTNSFAGYTVTVEPVEDALTGAIGSNTDSIPIGDLNVKLTSASLYSPLTFGTPLEVFRKTSPSAPAGDSISNDYKITIPFVQPDTYSATLEYVATTL
jgi:hypothetical protein